MQNRVEGRLFYSTSRQNMSLFSEIYMGAESLRIPVPMFWYRTSPFNFCQTFESSNITCVPSKYQNFDLSGRHAVNVSIN